MHYDTVARIIEDLRRSLSGQLDVTVLASPSGPGWPPIEQGRGEGSAMGASVPSVMKHQRSSEVDALPQGAGPGRKHQHQDIGSASSAVLARQSN